MSRISHGMLKYFIAAEIWNGDVARSGYNSGVSSISNIDLLILLPVSWSTQGNYFRLQISYKGWTENYWFWRFKNPKCVFFTHISFLKGLNYKFDISCVDLGFYLTQMYSFIGLDINSLKLKRAFFSLKFKSDNWENTA